MLVNNMWKFVAQIFFLLVPTIAKIIVGKLGKKKESIKPTSDEVLLDVATKTNEVQDEINIINTTPINSSDAVTSLRKRSTTRRKKSK